MVCTILYILHRSLLQITRDKNVSKNWFNNVFLPIYV